MAALLQCLNEGTSFFQELLYIAARPCSLPSSDSPSKMYFTDNQRYNEHRTAIIMLEIKAAPLANVWTTYVDSYVRFPAMCCIWPSSYRYTAVGGSCVRVVVGNCRLTVIFMPCLLGLLLKSCNGISSVATSATLFLANSPCLWTMRWSASHLIIFYHTTDATSGLFRDQPLNLSVECDSFT
ncbi:unnamed protein product [Mesocestoides corti]|uniref:Secreted protein n=1 Tax=Mesocestoides corti TaxID=53468 RepID=A0A0R3UQ72_MESCO|nr:unnamed protein product [Mesocestoides corti]